jgi:hypothetical protein
MAESKRLRPVFFNPLQIQMPVGALTSITHRVTGIVLVLGAGNIHPALPMGKHPENA